MSVGIIFGIATFIGIILITAIMRKGGGGKMISAKDASTALSDSKVILLDVRNIGEYATGHIKGSRLIPLSELANRIGELESFKNSRMIVYCHAGSRSSMACGILKQHGFLLLENLSGGITAWQGAGLPVVRK